MVRKKAGAFETTFIAGSHRGHVIGYVEWTVDPWTLRLRFEFEFSC